jgi:hypothetical protein
MPNQSQPFRQHHIARAIRAARAEGITNPTVEVRLPTGATIVIGGAGGKPDEKSSKERALPKRGRR